MEKRKKIYLTESHFTRLLTKALQEEASYYNPIADGNADHNPYKRTIEDVQEYLSSFLKTNGLCMVSLVNGKEYLVYELKDFITIIGKRYCICQLMKDGDLFGPIFIRPFLSFKLKN